MPREIKKYEVFKLAHQSALKIYAVTKNFPTEERYGLVSQMRRSAYSVPMNLMEGGSRNSEAEFRQFVNIARGSCAEIQYQLELSRDLSYLNQEQFAELNESYTSVGKMLTSLLGKLTSQGQ